MSIGAPSLSQIKTPTSNNQQNQKILTPKQIVNNPELFAAKFLKILDKKKVLRPFIWNAAQKDFHFKRTGRDLVLKARQLGFTTYIQGELFRRTVTGTRSSLTLTQDAEATKEMRAKADRFYENCRFGSIQPIREYDNATQATYPEFDSQAYIGTAGAASIGRGSTFTDIHGSEVAFWSDADKIIAGALEGGNPDVVFESTANGAQGAFYDLCNDAIRGQSGWTLHFYPWWWDAEYKIEGAGKDLILNDEETELSKKYGLNKDQIAWRRKKQHDLKDKFPQEYPEDPITCFLTSGNSYFGILTDIFTAPLEAEYIPGHEYVAGLDFGQTNDFTAMPIYNVTKKAQVDLLHIRKLKWKDQRQRIMEKYRQWHVSKCGAEMNSIGSVNAEELIDAGMNLIPFTTNNSNKAEIMSDMYEDVHENGWRLQDVGVQKREFTTFVSSQTSTGIWRLAAEGSGHDDTVMANAIALWAARMPSAKDLISWL